MVTAFSQLILFLTLIAGAGLLTGCETVTGDFWLTNPPPTPVEALQMTRDQYDPDRRRTGLLYLAHASWAGEDMYVSIYEVLAEDQDPTVRAMALIALGRHGRPDHVPLIAARLADDPDPLVRRQAALTLQRLHADEAINPLVATMKTDGDSGVRAAAAAALGQYPSEDVIYALLEALDDERLDVSHGARRSLRVLTGQDFGYHPVPWLAWLKTTDDPFAAGRMYTYETFHRDPNLLEFVVPFIHPPNETPGIPIGMPTGDDDAVGAEHVGS